MRPLTIALQGVLLFLFIPAVLFLFIRQPLGPGWSVGLGLLVMLGHRFVAAPWMARHAGERCLWCGTPRAAVAFPVASSGCTRVMTACSEAHATSIARFLRFVERFRRPIAVGIFLPLAALLLGSLARAAGILLIPHAVNALIFRVAVALTVVTVSVAYLAGPGAAAAAAPRDAASAPLRCPFPLHNLFLLGIANTLWVFRLVGAWWLIDGVARLAH